MVAMDCYGRPHKVLYYYSCCSNIFNKFRFLVNLAGLSHALTALKEAIRHSEMKKFYRRHQQQCSYTNSLSHQIAFIIGNWYVILIMIVLANECAVETVASLLHIFALNLYVCMYVCVRVCWRGWMQVSLQLCGVIYRRPWLASLQLQY